MRWANGFVTPPSRRRARLVGIAAIGVLAAAISLCVFAGGSSAAGVYCVWDGSTSPDWSVATNWSGDVVPGMGDYVTIPASGVTNNPSITSSDVSVAIVTVESGRTLTIGAGRTLTLEGGSPVGIQNSGTITGAGTVRLSGAVAVQDGSFDAALVATAGSSSLAATSGSAVVGGTVTVASGATLSGTIEARADVTVSGFLGATGSLTVLTFKGTTFTNNGTVDGIVMFVGPGGQIVAGTGAWVDTNFSMAGFNLGGLYVGSGSTTTVTNALTVSSSIWVGWASTLPIPGLPISSDPGGTLALTQPLTLSGSIFYNSGTVQGPSTFTTTGSGVTMLQYGSFTAPFVVAAGATMAAGDMAFSGPAVFEDTITVASGATLGGSVEARANVTVNGSLGGGGSVPFVILVFKGATFTNNAGASVDGIVIFARAGSQSLVGTGAWVDTYFSASGMSLGGIYVAQGSTVTPANALTVASGVHVGWDSTFPATGLAASDPGGTLILAHPLTLSGANTLCRVMSLGAIQGPSALTTTGSGVVIMQQGTFSAPLSVAGGSTMVIRDTTLSGLGVIEGAITVGSAGSLSGFLETPSDMTVNGTFGAGSFPMGIVLFKGATFTNSGVCTDGTILFKRSGSQTLVGEGTYYAIGVGEGSTTTLANSVTANMVMVGWTGGMFGMTEDTGGTLDVGLHTVTATSGFLQLGGTLVADVRGYGTVNRGGVAAPMAQLMGGLYVDLGTFSPAGGDLFPIVTTTSGITGTFDSLATSNATLLVSGVYAPDGAPTTMSLRIDGTPPTVDTLVRQTANALEGTSLWFSGSFSDAGPGPWSLVADHGDGTAPETVTYAADKTFNLYHTYVDEGSYALTVKVTDPDMISGSRTLNVGVSNAAPTVEAGSGKSISEGGTVSLAPATFSDPGIADTHTASINWGDGTTTTGVVTQGAGSGSVAGSHTYTDNGIFTVTVTVTDNDGGVGSDTFTVTVANAAPTVEAGSGKSISEGGTVSLAPATFSDPGIADTHTASINWGDGTTTTGAVTQGAGSGSVAASHVYADNGTFTVTVSVTDDDGGTGSDTFTVTVANVAPTVEAGANQTTDEGTAVALAPATFTDPGTADTHTSTIDWGDGTATAPGTVTESGGSGSAAASHVYADNGTYAVTVTVTDDDGGSDSDTFTVTVANVAPTVGAGAGLDGPEGTALSLAFVTLTDPGTADTHTATIDWGDGMAVESGAVTESAGSGSVAGSHTYVEDGVYTVTITVTDDDGGVGSDTFTVTVANAAPTVEAGANQTTDEGTAVALAPATFTDPGIADTHTASVNWGDGTTTTGAVTQGAGSGSAAASHVYADNGTFTVTVSVTDDDGGTGSDTFTVTVANVAPTVEAGANQTTDEGTAVALAPATFTDPGIADTHTASINWGDGTTTTGAVTQGAGSGSAAASHVYADNGTFTVTVSVTDDDGSVGSDTFTVTVANVAPTVETGADVCTSEGSGASLNLATFTDPGTADTHSASINWGDGTTTAGVVTQSAGSGSVVGSHAYGDDGVFTVTVTVADDDLGVGSGSITLTVRNVGPKVRIDMENAMTLDGRSLFVSRVGAQLGLAVDISDPGSDDLTVVFPTGGYHTYYNNGVSPDPYPSTGGTFPMRASLTVATGHDLPGIYLEEASCRDDDGGVGADSVVVAVRGVETQQGDVAAWLGRFSPLSAAASGAGSVGAQAVDDSGLLNGYLSLVRYYSGYLGNDVYTHRTLKLQGVGDAAAILAAYDGGSTEEQVGALLLAAWLNYACGARQWGDLLDTNADGRTDLAYCVALYRVEQVLCRDDASEAELEEALATIGCCFGRNDGEQPEGPADVQTFSDVSSAHGYYHAIEGIAARGIITGFADGSFKPDDPVSRQQFAKMIVRTLGLTVTGQEICRFNDVAAGQDADDPLYPTSYVAVCAANGITKGMTPTQFAPYSDITRQQLISMVARAAGLGTAPAAFTPPFGAARFSLLEHYENARNASHAGLLDNLAGLGSSYQFLVPATRGECAQLLWSLLLLSER